MLDEIEQRDQLIYDAINNRFSLERQRTNNLDQKASSIIGFVGIMVSLQVGLGGLLIKEIPKYNNFYVLFSVFFVSGILSLICSIICGLKAYHVKKWKLVPDTEYLIKEYAKKDKSRTDILRILSAEISDSIKHNGEINDKKAKFIEYSSIFLVLGIALTFIFIFSILLT